MEVKQIRMNDESQPSGKPPARKGTNHPITQGQEEETKGKETRRQERVKRSRDEERKRMRARRNRDGELKRGR